MKKNRDYDTARERIRVKRDPLLRKQIQDKMRIAARIEDIVDELGLSKVDFAKLVGRKPSVITKWLSGTHNFTQETYSLIEFKTNKCIAKVEEQQLHNVQIQIQVVYKEINTPIFNSPNKFPDILVSEILGKRGKDISFKPIASC